MSAEHRMRIKEGDEWKTAFQTWYGHFEYQLILFGLSNAPASFQGYINKLLAKKLDIFVILSLDNIFIYIVDPGHAPVNAVWWVLKELRKYSVFSKLKKCRFYKDEVRFLRYVVSAQGVRMEEKRINAVKNWPKPKSICNIQVFLGFANFYRRFFQGFSKIGALLTSMVRMSPTPTMQKLLNLVDEFGGGDHSKNEARKAYVWIKEPSGADYLSFDHVSHAVSNIVNNSAKNVGNYPTPDAKRAFDQLRQAFT